MNGINKAIVVGTLCADPETRFTSDGLAITTIRIATNEKWKDRETGEKRERAEYHRAKAFGRLAEIMSEFLKKGSQVYIEGKLRTDEYVKDDIKRHSTGILIDDLQMLGSKEKRGNDDGPAEYQRPATATTARAPTSSKTDSFEDDEIPF